MASLLRCAGQLAGKRVISSRTFTMTAISRKDLVQDLYISEIKAYKPPPPAKDAHVGVVKPYSSPTIPTPPPNPTDLASELSAYDAQEPTTVSATVTGATAGESVADEVGTGAKEFLAFLEKDLPKPVHDHH